MNFINYSNHNGVSIFTQQPQDNSGGEGQTSYLNHLHKLLVERRMNNKIRRQNKKQIKQNIIGRHGNNGNSSAQLTPTSPSIGSPMSLSSPISSPTVTPNLQLVPPTPYAIMPRYESTVAVNSYQNSFSNQDGNSSSSTPFNHPVNMNRGDFTASNTPYYMQNNSHITGDLQVQPSSASHGNHASFYNPQLSLDINNNHVFTNNNINNNNNIVNLNYSPPQTSSSLNQQQQIFNYHSSSIQSSPSYLQPQQNNNFEMPKQATLSPPGTPQTKTVPRFRRDNKMLPKLMIPKTLPNSSSIILDQVTEMPPTPSTPVHQKIQSIILSTSRSKSLPVPPSSDPNTPVKPSFTLDNIFPNLPQMMHFSNLPTSPSTKRINCPWNNISLPPLVTAVRVGPISSSSLELSPLSNSVQY